MPDGLTKGRKSEMPPIEKDLTEIDERIRALLSFAGTNGKCRHCQEPIIWIRQGIAFHAFKSFNADGTSHAKTCSAASSWYDIIEKMK
jgi:hypothetical protein